MCVATSGVSFIARGCWRFRVVVYGYFFENAGGKESVLCNKQNGTRGGALMFASFGKTAVGRNVVVTVIGNVS